MTTPTSAGSRHRTTDVLVVGAGLAGLSAARQASAAGARTRVIAKGWGAQYWLSGGIGVLGYHPLGQAQPVASPADALAALAADQPRHPYALAGVSAVAEAVSDIQHACADNGLALEGSIDRNWLLSSPLGGRRPICLAPSTMTGGDLTRRDPMLIVGLTGYPDFPAGLVAANLEAQDMAATAAEVDLVSFRQRRFLNATVLASLFDLPEIREEAARAIRPRLGSAGRVGMPAVLGMESSEEAVSHLSDLLGVEVFEIATAPPSVPGIRLHRALVRGLVGSGVRVSSGMQVVGSESNGSTIEAVYSEAAARRVRHAAGSFVIATGGILGGGLITDEDGSVTEVVADIPVKSPATRSDWFRREVLDSAGHPIYRAGIEVDSGWRPLDSGKVVWENVTVAGGLLAEAETIREHSMDGVAVATGFLAGRAAAASLVPG
ncbi:MAG TPA: glycerol-3-phosphate dehydrogenase subunit GlpB [Acidimicrobiia bacterium]|nr:glycerol-3-phosphate dehydrogenase subunit GlpB [Acidimicrobiia bacterium]